MVGCQSRQWGPEKAAKNRTCTYYSTCARSRSHAHAAGKEYRNRSLARIDEHQATHSTLNAILSVLQKMCQCGSLGLSNPYVQVPSSALRTATIITETPLPMSAKSGPGQAPVSAHPRPNIVPPTA